MLNFIRKWGFPFAIGILFILFLVFGGWTLFDDPFDREASAAKAREAKRLKALKDEQELAAMEVKKEAPPVSNEAGN